MTARPEPATEHLLDAAARGDGPARNRLIERYRRRLKRMVAVRLDRRLSARVDPSDVVQDTLADAARKLDGYLRDRPLPFYPWLRQLAADRLGTGRTAAGLGQGPKRGPAAGRVAEPGASRFGPTART